jgi:hypothetical protein
MNWDVHFDRPTRQNLGRHGYTTSHGLQVFCGWKSNEIWLSPLKRNGEAARCSIAIPVENLDALIEKLLQARTMIAEEMAAEQRAGNTTLSD